MTDAWTHLLHLRCCTRSLTRQRPLLRLLLKLLLRLRRRLLGASHQLGPKEASKHAHSAPACRELHAA